MGTHSLRSTHADQPGEWIWPQNESDAQGARCVLLLRILGVWGNFGEGSSLCKWSFRGPEDGGRLEKLNVGY